MSFDDIAAWQADDSSWRTERLVNLLNEPGDTHRELVDIIYRHYGMERGNAADHEKLIALVKTSLEQDPVFTSRLAQDIAKQAHDAYMQHHVEWELKYDHLHGEKNHQPHKDYETFLRENYPDTAEELIADAHYTDSERFIAHIDPKFITAEELLEAVKDIDPLVINSTGQSRSGFVSTHEIPYMRTGIGGEWEAVHTGIPVGAHIIIGGVGRDSTNVDFTALLNNGDIYPYWSKGQAVEERDQHYHANTLVLADQPPARDRLRDDAQNDAVTDAGLALSMRMFSVPTSKGDISIYDPRLAAAGDDSDPTLHAEAVAFLKSKGVQASAVQLGNLTAGSDVVHAIRSDMAESFDIGTRTDKPVKAYFPEGGLVVITPSGAMWEASAQTAIVIRDNKGAQEISTLSASKIRTPDGASIETGPAAGPVASDDYVITGPFSPDTGRFRCDIAACDTPNKVVTPARGRIGGITALATGPLL